MLLMSPAYWVLFCAILSCFVVREKKISFGLTILTVVAAWIQGVMDERAIAVACIFYGASYLYYGPSKYPSWLKKISLFLMVGGAMLGTVHRLPGFYNTLQLDQVQISDLSHPYSMYLNLDAAVLALIVFVQSPLYKTEKILGFKSFMQTGLILCGCVGLLLGAGTLSGYVKFDIKIPDILLIWVINNLVFVCFAEEVIFRGFIQNKFKNLMHPFNRPWGRVDLPLMASALVFVLKHFEGGVTYIALSAMAGLFYGWAYEKTGRILSSMLVHFGLNLIHLIFFTYPSALKIHP